MRRRVFAVGTILTAAALVASAVPAAQAVPADPLRKYTTQRLEWKPCAGSRLRCATLLAPRDWHRPGVGPDVKIAISRLKAAKPEQRRGVLLINPGGPGASGLTLPLAIGSVVPAIAQAYDLIGFDPRGVGRSTRIRCQTAAEYERFTNIDMRDRSSENIQRVLRESRQIADNCHRRSGELLRYVNTDQTVRDMDLIRSLLGARKINYLGYSGGTRLGAYYATVFPDRVDRFVLDSNNEFTASWEESLNWQPLGFERRFNEDFLAWIAKHDKTYHYGRTARQARARWEARRAALQQSPLKVSDTFTLTAAGLDNGTVLAMYSANGFPQLATALAALEHFDSATTEEKQAIQTAFGPFFDADLYAVYYSVTCNDTRWTRDSAYWLALSERFGRQYPLIGYSWLAQPCAYWPFRADRPLKVDGRGVPPVLMINSVHDPATPIEGAVRAHRRFANSRLLTVENEGDHGIYASGNKCVQDVVNRFLLAGRIPARDTTCPGVPLPEPRSDSRARAVGGRPQNILVHNWELTRQYADSFPADAETGLAGLLQRLDLPDWFLPDWLPLLTGLVVRRSAD
ncbi:TAP domain containing protein [Carbonactinospora thermoautotrophica]|uniref:TAP domain containing protein n=1 Tax=Carbonactinospora thermoautotrophica TaxID=1469144 RepID=A0A132MN36_9ACTN|nr:alpha/beta hydrolase [Carbonactinospora thermoautotrophica]KWW98821.1 TAP domain containing protein [Carbonactinospora thermoautotrophica]